MRFETLSVHPKGYAEHDQLTGAVIPTISLSTTFAQDEPAKPIGVQEKEIISLKSICLLVCLLVGIRIFQVR